MGEIIEGNALAAKCDYNFGDHHVAWDYTLTGEFKVANFSNAEFLVKCQKNEDKVLTLFIDNIRLYNRQITLEGQHAEQDAKFISYLMQTNDLLALCKMFPKNKFVIFTSHEDTPITDPIEIPDNVLGIYAVNGLSNHPKIHPSPIGLQRKRGTNDNRLDIMQERLLTGEAKEPSKLLYINCGVERNPERLPLLNFESNSWCTTRFNKDSQFYSYDRYNEFLDELQDHKFVVCPKGHGYDTHRIWETLYMRRVPVMLDDPYFRRLLEGFPVLFVEAWDKIIPWYLNTWGKVAWYEAQHLDFNKLDLNIIFKNIMEQYV